MPVKRRGEKKVIYPFGEKEKQEKKSLLSPKIFVEKKKQKEELFSEIINIKPLKKQENICKSSNLLFIKELILNKQSE